MASVRRGAAMGWQDTVILSNDHARLVITTEAGPRIIGYQRRDGDGFTPNILKVFEHQAGQSGEDTFMIRGGHRLWVAPEGPATYFPDNHPVTVTPLSGAGVKLTAPAEHSPALQKHIEVQLDDNSAAVTLRHRIDVLEAPDGDIAAWSLTVMAAGGFAEIPLPPRTLHPDETPATAVVEPADLLPNRTLALWPYTDPVDERFEWQEPYLRIHQRQDSPATKLGFNHRLGQASYVLDGLRFTKSVPHDPGCTYPDGNVNLEVFTNGEMLELETLGPLASTAAGDSIEHVEQWQLEFED